jgi:sigma-B regulation protein RsbU (phosphoserine phosphatase)
MPEPPAPLPSADELFEQAPIGLLVLAANGTILKVNRTFCAWLNLTPDDLVGRRRLQELFTVGGRIFHQTHWLPMLEMQGSLSEVKLDLKHRDGRTFPVMLNVIRRVRDSGTLDEVSVSMAEERNKYERELLAARKRADGLLASERAVQERLKVTQSRLRQALRLGSLYLWEMDLATGQRHYDHEVARLLGHTTARPVSEDEFSARVHGADRGVEHEALAATIAGAQTYHCTYRVKDLSGGLRTVESSGSVLLDEDGKMTRIVGVLSDITDIARQREQAEDRALFAEQMVGIVSHDLRTPLSAILVGSQMLARGETSETKVRLAGRVTSSAQRAQRLVEDLLDFTLIRVGRGLSVSRRPADVHALVAATVEELALSVPGRALDCRHSGDGQGSVDPDRLAQLVGNLVSNACTHGAPDMPISIVTEGRDHVMRISVSNHGTPIAPEQQARIFEPMVRGATSDSVARSVGLGLYIVRAIAAAHEGEVSVASGPDRTTFAFTFPTGDGAGLVQGEGDGLADSKKDSQPAATPSGPPTATSVRLPLARRTGTDGRG